MAPDATAFVHRNALCSIQHASDWTRPSGATAGLSWIRGVYRRMRPFVSGFAYQNHIDPDLARWPHAYYGANLARLVDVKTTHDPDEVFPFRRGSGPPEGAPRGAAPHGRTGGPARLGLQRRAQQRRDRPRGDPRERRVRRLRGAALEEEPPGQLMLSCRLNQTTAARRGLLTSGSVKICFR